MRKMNLGVVGVTLAAVLALSACDDKDQELFVADTYFAELKTERFVDRKGDELDVAAIVAAVPDNVLVKYDDIAFDKKTGATVLTNVRFSPADSPDVGLRAETIAIWGGNAANFADRLSAKPMTSDSPIASRIEATNMTVFGLEKMFEPLMEASNNMVDGVTEGMTNGEVDIPRTELDDYQFTVGKMVMTDFVMHPVTLNLLSPSEGQTDEDMVFMHALQKMGAYYSMVSLDDWAIYDASFSLTYREGDVPMSMSGEMEYNGTKGLNRGDLKYSTTRNMSYDIQMSVPDVSAETGEVKTVKMDMSGLYESSTVRDMRLAKAMGHLARGVMPDRTETDFMSLGVWDAGPMTVMSGDNMLYSVGSYSMDMSRFHWLVPEIIDFRVDDIAYNTPGFMAFIQDTASQEDASDPDMERMMEMMPEITEILRKYDSEVLSFDFNLLVDWDAETGQTAMGYGLGLDDYMRWSTSAKGVVPDFDAVMEIMPEDMKDMDETALQGLLAEVMQLERYDMKLADEGGFEKIFAMAKDFAALAPEDNPQAAGLRNFEPAQMREMVAGMMLLGAGSATQVFPPASEYLQAFSNFIREGGDIALTVAPPTPLGFEEIMPLATYMQSDPEKVVETLGLSVVHTKPDTAPTE